ncbi:MAG: Na/Pi cotransporter family protein [Chromatiales bacterium]|nr:Na/Pi cotransporter family protein [Chromatiales bacterium]
MSPPMRPLVGLALLICASAAFAANGDQSMQWGTMAMSLFGGLALFLFGMEQMSEALKAVAGERMKLVLARLTTNRFMGAATGALVTAIIQSSSVTTVLVVGFISAGLMSMAQSIGVIMGANIGTTITAQIIAFKITKFALLMIAIGFGLWFFGRADKLKQYGAMIMGLGLVFFGMSVMSDAMSPLRSYQPFLDLMTRMENPLIGILVAAVFTALVQSSSATTGIVIVMASQGFVTLPAGIALAFGANVGTCVTAMLAAIGKPREALRAALVHVLFNVFGVLLWLGLINWLAGIVTTLSPAHPELQGSARLAAEVPRQIANAHTVFNLANTLIFIGFTAQFARLVEWLVPDRPLPQEEKIRPKFLDTELLDTPSLALDRVRFELARVGEFTSQMLEAIMPALIRGNVADLQRIAKLDDQVDTLHGDIITYLGQLSRRPLTPEQTDSFLAMMAIANDLESIGDLMETDLTKAGERRLQRGFSISSSTAEKLTELHGAVLEELKKSLKSLSQADVGVAKEVVEAKDRTNQLAEAAFSHAAKRLIADEPNRLGIYRLEVEIIEKLRRIYYFSKRIAKAIAEGKPQEGKAEEA